MTTIGSDVWVIFTKRPRGDMGPSWAECTSCCWGVAKLDSTLEQFVPQVLFPLKSPLFGLVTASQSVVVPAEDGGADWVYFCLRAPEVRVRADKLMNISAYEMVNVAKPLAFGSFGKLADDVEPVPVEDSGNALGSIDRVEAPLLSARERERLDGAAAWE